MVMVKKVSQLLAQIFVALGRAPTENSAFEQFV
jgi:hypothetical protein